jgi:hypothetical protein
MEISGKIKQSFDIISSEYVPGKSVVLCSFGKDSMVLLDLVMKKYGDIPIGHYSLPGYPKKKEFALKFIQKLNLVVHNIPIMAMDIFMDSNGKFELMVFLPISKDKCLMPCVDIIDTREKNCIFDLLAGPFYSNTVSPWTVFFVGHKQSDVDSFFGPVPISKDRKLVGDIKICYPLKDWTDEDIWQYTIENGIPYNDKCYNKDNNFLPFEDTTYNPHYYSACTDCINPNKPKEVYCRIASRKIPNKRFGDMDYYPQKHSFYRTILNQIL